MDQAIKESCETCEFWNWIGKEGLPGLPRTVAQCRRHAPTALMPIGEGWPSTSSADWCGEFSPILFEREPVERTSSDEAGISGEAKV